MKINYEMKSFKIHILYILILLFTIQAQAVEPTQKMNYFLRLLESQYIEEVDLDSLVEVGISSMLEHLDPHSVYLSHDDLVKANEPLEGNFEGVGIQFNIFEDTINVVHVIIGGPSQKVGLQDGDKIVTIDGDTVAGVGFTNDDVLKRLRGKKGTEVVVGIKRSGEKQILEYLIERDKIPLYALDAAYIIKDDIGYIKLSRFAASATEEVSQAIDSLQKHGMKNLILDLSGNGGGYLEQAKGLADLFLDQDKLVVYTEGRAQPRNDLYATSKGNFETGKLVIMIDGSSASASEIVSGAVQDWDRGVLVGRRTYGKGLVQKGYNLPDFSAVRLTMAHYYIPSGRSIQKPYGKGFKKYMEDVVERYESGELFDESKMIIADSTPYYTAGNRLVYGGGGVIPDVYVPLDTTWSTDFYRDLLRKGVFNKFTLKYVNEHRDELKKQYPTATSFIQDFQVSDKLWADFLDYAAQNEVEPKEDAELKKDNMQLQLKALIAQNIFDSKVYFQAINTLDPIYNKALQIIQSKEYNQILKPQKTQAKNSK